MADDSWGLAEAKAKFSELVERARTCGPQHVTRNGKDAVVVVATEDWLKHDRPPETLYDYLARSPLRGSGIQLERIRGKMRDIDS
jgi:prevent-host-death family protein